LERLADHGRGTLFVRRRQFIKARIRVLNAAGALVRRALGWHQGLDEASSAKISKQAAQVIAAVTLNKDDPSLPPSVGSLPDHLLDIARELISEITTAKLMALPGEDRQHYIEMDMRRIARQLPVWKEWAESVKGFSDLGLAIVNVLLRGDQRLRRGPSLRSFPSIALGG
jgi:hypothetical protein